MAKYELHCMDCLEYMKTMPDKSVDAIITDLPYGTTACAWDEIIPFAPMWEQANRICRGAFVTTASQPFTSKLILSNIGDYRYGWVWNKKLAGNALNSDYQPLKIHEDVCVFSKNGHTYNPILRKGDMRTKMWNGNFPEGTMGEEKETKAYKSDTYKPQTILDFYLRRTGRVHPAQKPVELIAYLVRTYTNDGDTVLDFVMGSGTTGVACMQLGRNFIGVEIDEKYFNIAKKRIENAAAQMVMPLP